MPVKRARSEERAVDEAYRIAAARQRETLARAGHTQRSRVNPEAQARAPNALIREADEQTQDRQCMASSTE
jgi:hypothetical protein